MLSFYVAEVNIPMEFATEVNIGCRSPQFGAEVTHGEHRLTRIFMGKLAAVLLGLISLDAIDYTNVIVLDINVQ